MNGPNTEQHICVPEFVGEGEVVCFECGALYIYSGILNDEEKAACRAEIEARAE